MTRKRGRSRRSSKYRRIKKYSIKATFFITSDMIGRRSSWLSKDDIKWLSEVHELGSHTKNHVPLTYVSENSARKELLESKRVLEAIVERPVAGLAYPYGLFNENIKRIAMEVGYTYARTTRPWWIGVIGEDSSLMIIDNYEVDVTLQLKPLSLISSRRIEYLMKSLKPIFLRAYMYHFSRECTDNGCNLINLILTPLKKYNMDVISFIEYLLSILLQLSMKKDVKFVINLWGHSWEFMTDKEFSSRFENLLCTLSALRKHVRIATLGELFAKQPYLNG